MLCQKLIGATSPREKIGILNENERVIAFLKKEEIPSLTPECESVLKQLVAIGEWERICGGETDAEKIRALLERLVPIDLFYHELGGVLGYHETIVRFLKEKGKSEAVEHRYHAPFFRDITEETKETEEATLAGIRDLPLIGEMYPLGGAADRLHLVDEATGTELPAAKLKVGGRTLLEGLIRDLEAREYLYYKMYGKQVTTPIAMMTSLEKDNHRHILEILEEKRWFFRPKESFRIFSQPLVPAVDEEGRWCLLGPLKPLLKPGGHGAIWKLARDASVFAWLENQGREKALVRQINNPAAGLDYGLLAFIGIGCEEKMLFGFASCARRLEAAEGVNVLIEKGGKEIVLSNIEYCDFAKFGIEDVPLKENEPYSKFSSNTNILFIDLKAVNAAVAKCPYPGLLINLKKGAYTTDAGEKKEIPFARLESTMQNIADVFVEEKKDSLKTERTFVTYNHRHKTISTAKRAYVPGRPLQETPENCFYELMAAARELLETRCKFLVPKQRTLEEYLDLGPEFLFLYHPALGPLYSHIAKKVQGGSLALGSSLELEIAELALQNLNLEGSLKIVAAQTMGHLDSNGILRYSDRVGRCTLKNVTVKNRGIDWSASKPYWKAQNRVVEGVEIVLEGKSEFVAENVTLTGSHRIVVKDGMRITLRQKGQELIFEEVSGG